MTLYKKAWIFSSFVSIFGLIAFMVGEHLALSYGFIARIGMGLLWLTTGVPLILFFNCERCGTSIFCRSGSRSLWKTDKVTYFPQQIVPMKKCAKCGKDHTIAD